MAYLSDIQIAQACEKQPIRSIAARAGINRYSTLPNLAISPGATLAYPNLTSTAAASSDGSAQVLWTTLGGGGAAASPDQSVLNQILLLEPSTLTSLRATMSLTA